LEKAIDLTIKTFGRLDIMINNAGVGMKETDYLPGEKKTLERWPIIDINLTAVINGTILAIQKMKEQQTGGVIVNTASMGGLVPMSFSPIYSASKAAVVHFTKSLVHFNDLHKIRVNAICPSFTETKLSRQYATSNQDEAIKKTIGRYFNLGEHC